MAQIADVLRRQKQHLPTEMLYRTDTKFGNIVPAYNNSYDVFINFSSAAGLLNFINQHGFYDQSNEAEPGDYLRLFCSEAVLPGSSLRTTEVPGQRQGIMSQMALMRNMTDLTLTFFSQKDYYTNDVFNAWMEYTQPTRNGNGVFGDSTRERRNAQSAYRRAKYPVFYKCEIEITAFSNDIFNEGRRLEGQQRFPIINTPSSITYYIQNAFPVNIVAAPLAYGNAQLIKTTIAFKFDNFFIDRTSRVGGILSISDRPPINRRGANISVPEDLKSTTLKPFNLTSDEASTSNTSDSTESASGWDHPYVRQRFGLPPK
tara:strand:- start:7934 stop:8881 length:948 start_codon:yes stop_codon:yes gene_type:complete